jgi:hypothetical protein
MPVDVFGNLVQGYFAGQDRANDAAIQLARQIAQQHALQLQAEEINYQHGRDTIGDTRQAANDAERQQQQGQNTALGLYGQGVPRSQIGSGLSAFPNLPEVNPEIQRKVEESTAKRQSQEKIAQIKADLANASLGQKTLTLEQQISMKHALNMADTPEEAQRLSDWFRTNFFKPITTTAQQGMPANAPQLPSAPFSMPPMTTNPQDLSQSMDLQQMAGQMRAAQQQPQGQPQAPQPGGFDPSAPFGGKIGSQNDYRDAMGRHLDIIDKYLPQKLELQASQIGLNKQKLEQEIKLLQDPNKKLILKLQTEKMRQDISNVAEKMRQDREKYPFELAILKAKDKPKAIKENLGAILKAKESVSSKILSEAKNLDDLRKEARELSTGIVNLEPDDPTAPVKIAEVSAVAQSIRDGEARKKALEGDLNDYLQMQKDAKSLIITNANGKAILPSQQGKGTGLPTIIPPNVPTGRSGKPLSAKERLLQKYKL